MAEGATQQILPTVIGFASRLAIAAPLLKRAGLSPSVLAIPQKRISAASQGKFLEYAAEALDDSAFGLHLAEGANPRITGLLFYAMSAAKTLGEALKLLTRYSRIVNDSVRLKLERRGDGVVAEINYVGVSRHQARQFTEFGVAHTLRCFREIAGRNIKPVRVSCGHWRNADLREFERYYGCLLYTSPSPRDS